MPDDWLIDGPDSFVAVLRMRLELDPAHRREPIWPDKVGVRSFGRADAEPLHALLEHGYRGGGGSVATFEMWLPQMTSDEEFDPELWFLAERHQGLLVGAVLCWTSGFVKDLVVRESWRRCGLGEALLLNAFNALATRGANAVELKVQVGNRNAIRLYERLGMRVVERLPGS